MSEQLLVTGEAERPSGSGEPVGARPATAAGPTARALRALLAVLPQWATARALVIGALALGHLVVDRVHPAIGTAAAHVHQGLLGWDAGWYKAIATVGYLPLGRQSVRFFPLFPLLGHAVAVLPGVGDGAAVVAIANVSALVATAMLVALVRRETGDEALAVRAAWLFSLAPPAFTLAMGYAEGLLAVGTVGCFLALRRAGRAPSWWWVAVAAFGAALTRPLGALLVLPIAVAALRRWSVAGTGERLRAAVAVAAPVAGVGAFLCWSWATFGDAWLPVQVQTESGHHGGLADPFATLAHDAAGVRHHVGTALHVPWAVLVVLLLIVCWLRWPSEYGAFATGVVMVALTGTNLDSFERYALSAFPVVLAAAGLLSRPQVERVVLTLAAAGLVGYALLAFLGLSVP
ncbi:MAG: mannosyltransferase family protein [Acidimicrobiales bacterium]